MLLHYPNHFRDDLLLDPHENEAVDHQLVGEVEGGKIFSGNCAVRPSWLDSGDVPSRIYKDRLHILCQSVQVSFYELALFDFDDLGQTSVLKVICEIAFKFSWGRRFQLFISFN